MAEDQLPDSPLRARVVEFRDAHRNEYEIPEFCNWILGYLDGFDIGVNSVGIRMAGDVPKPTEK